MFDMTKLESSSRPSLSVIIPTRNRVRYLRRSLDALIQLAEAELPDTEIIVIDGGSNDGTVELLKSYGDKIRYWISEPDRSVAEAFNKGLRLASGAIIRPLGDDDEVIPGGIAKMVRYLSEHPECDAVAGHNQVFLEDASGKLTFFPQKKFVGNVSLEDLRAFPHKGIFIPECLFLRREFIEKCGGYDEGFCYWGYLDFFFRLVKAGFRLRVVPEQILITYQTPESDSIAANGNARWKQEWKLLQKRHNTIYWRIWQAQGGEFTLASPLKYLLRKVFNRIGFAPRAYLRSLQNRLFQGGRS